jgi:RHS repeat-associated protein
MTVAGQPAVTYAFDNANRLLTITQGSNVVTVTYDAAGRRTSVILPNGLATEYTYDAASRVTGLAYRKDTTTLGTLSYTYDAAGNRVGVGGTWARTGLPPALDAASYDAANRPLTFGGQVLASDLNGNLLSDGTSGYTWDARNRLTGITGPSTATFQYDAAGRRTRKTINSLTTDFVHNGITPVTESSAGGTGFLLTGLGVDDFLMRIGPVSTSMFLTDALGSLVATTDSAGGLQSEVTYEPFGNTEMSAPAPAYRFTGREHDEPLYLYYYRARYYHTDLQRFISEDPIEFFGGDVNLYAYARGNPIDLLDPLGLDPSKSSFSCGGRPTVVPVVANASNDSRIRSMYAGYRKFWGPVPDIPVCIAKLPRTELARYSRTRGRETESLLVAENFFDGSPWLQLSSIGHELTHLWQNNNIGFIHLDLGQDYPVELQPLEIHAESVGRAFANRVLGIGR